MKMKMNQNQMFHKNDSTWISHSIQIQIQIQNQRHLPQFDSIHRCPETQSASDSIPQSLPPSSQIQKPAGEARWIPWSLDPAFCSIETTPFPKSSSFHRSDLPPPPVHSGPYEPDSPLPRIRSARSSTTIQHFSLSNAVIPNDVVRLQQRQQLHFSQDLLIFLHAVFQVDLLNLRHTSIPIPTAYFIPSNRWVHSVIRPNPPWPISLITMKSVLNRPIADYKTSRYPHIYRFSACQFFGDHLGTPLLDFIQGWKGLGRILRHAACSHFRHVLVLVDSLGRRAESP